MICKQEEIRVLVRALASAKTKVNLGQLLNVCTVNALGQVMMGKRVFGDGSGGADPQADEFKSMVVELMQLAGVFNIGDFIPALEWLDLQGVQGKMKKLHQRFDRFLSGILEEHKTKARQGKGKVTHMDLLSTLISLEDVDGGEGEKLSDTEIKALLLVLFPLSVLFFRNGFVNFIKVYINCKRGFGSKHYFSEVLDPTVKSNFCEF